jgi:hypothetical protein
MLAPEPAFLFCAWYDLCSAADLALGATGFRAATSHESVPSKWSGLTSDCALHPGVKSSKAPKPAKITDNLNKLNGFMRDLHFLFLPETQG